MDKEKIENLIQKYDKGLCSEREKALLETWYAEWNKDKVVDISDEAIKEDLSITRQKTLHTINQAAKSARLWPKFAAAAAVIITIGTGWFYLGKQGVKRDQQLAINVDIDPGSIGATLTLANGKRIKLGAANNGKLAQEAGVTITKTAEGELIYEVNNPIYGASDRINMLSTGNGETYRVRLPDKTEVWLNAASVLKYPASFANDAQRKVELEGEAYFQVAKDKNHPFIVRTNTQQIKVFGTHFNVKGYANEPIKTTLVEGSVQVSNQFTSAMLKPGQQSILSVKGNFVVGPSDEVLDLAWKNNEFMFESDSIEDVMKMVERWYNVEVVYVGEKSSEKFGGGVSRFDKVSKVLELLERTGAVKFKIENKKIFVTSAR